MSKSRGTFIAAETYLAHLNPEYLRYYYAFKLGPGIDDIDLNLEDFVARTNSDLVGKFVNIASRCASFITKRFDGRLSATLENPALYGEFVQAGTPIAELYQAREFSRAMREIMKLADRANQYIDEHKPWQLARDEAQLPQVQLVCTQGLNMFRALATYLQPVLPDVVESAMQFLNVDELRWTSPEQPLLGTKIEPFKPLLTRVEEQAIARIVEDSKENLPPAGSES
jgi:methionyl-tRNA synthetase